MASLQRAFLAARDEAPPATTRGLCSLSPFRRALKLKLLLEIANAERQFGIEILVVKHEQNVLGVSEAEVDDDIVLAAAFDVWIAIGYSGHVAADGANFLQFAAGPVKSQLALQNKRDVRYFVLVQLYPRICSELEDGIDDAMPAVDAINVEPKIVEALELPPWDIAVVEFLAGHVRFLLDCRYVLWAPRPESSVRSGTIRDNGGTPEALRANFLTKKARASHQLAVWVISPVVRKPRRGSLTMNLKWLLVRRITLVALACLVAGSVITIYRVSSVASRENAELTLSVSRQLNLQLLRIDTMLDIPKRFPDWDLVTSYALQPGQCIQLLRRDASVWRSSCAGIDTVSKPAPQWFVSVYTSLIGGEALASLPVSYRGNTAGSVVATFNPAAVAGETWRAIAPVFGFSALLIALLCIVTYYVIDSALRPTVEILRGLNRLAKGDLDARLPPFRVSEINRISEVFNALVSDLKRASAERAELARRLVDAQEQERRHIARELHDEIAQKLSAVSALAACLRMTAQQDAKHLEGEARQLEDMASGLMISLRKTLTHLRPQDIDDLGLLPSLEGLVAGHNKDANGRTRYTIEANGNIEDLNSETRAHVYRIVQEGLNNAAKHANAQRVKVTLNQLGKAGANKVELAITDDGTGPADDARHRPFAGSGLIGMRERVLALSGSFNAGPIAQGGFGLRVEFPLHPQGGAA